MQCVRREEYFGERRKWGRRVGLVGGSGRWIALNGVVRAGFIEIVIFQRRFEGDEEGIQGLSREEGLGGRSSQSEGFSVRFQFLRRSWWVGVEDGVVGSMGSNYFVCLGLRAFLGFGIFSFKRGQFRVNWESQSFQEVVGEEVWEGIGGVIL